MGLHDEANLDHKFVAFAKQMNLYLNHFPKHEKYGLAQHALHPQTQLAPPFDHTERPTS